MPRDEYAKALDKAVSDLEDRIQRRDRLNAEIAGLRETVRVLSTLAGLPSKKQKRVAQLFAMVDYASPSLTDAIRSLLICSYPREMTAIEVRDALEESAFNFGDFSNSLSACHTALKRLAIEGEYVKNGKRKEGKATYHGILKAVPRPPLPKFWDSFVAELATGATNPPTAHFPMGSRSGEKNQIYVFNRSEKEKSERGASVGATCYLRHDPTIDK